MRRYIVALCALFAITLTCSAQSHKYLYRNSVRCLGTELDGSETLRIVGYGRNRNDAKEQAMKNAVYAVLFEGIKDGNKGCNMRPIIEETNAREKYQEYFDIFFTDGGEYLRYVSLRDTKKRSANKDKTKIGYAYEMTIRVDRSGLRYRLLGDRVILR